MAKNPNLSVVTLLQVGKAIHELRKRTKLSITHVCSSTGIGNKSYYRIIKGEEVKIGYYFLILFYLLNHLYGEQEKKRQEYFIELMIFIGMETEKELERRIEKFMNGK